MSACISPRSCATSYTPWACHTEGDGPGKKVHFTKVSCFPIFLHHEVMRMRMTVEQFTMHEFLWRLDWVQVDFYTEANIGNLMVTQDGVQSEARALDDGSVIMLIWAGDMRMVDEFWHHNIMPSDPIASGDWSLPLTWSRSDKSQLSHDNVTAICYTPQPGQI